MHAVELRGVSYAYPEGTELVFHELSLQVPAGVVALVGQNGTGKSTFMLLASGIAVPSDGTVLLHGIDTQRLREPYVRQRQVSLIHQNMEFETEQPIGDLIAYVYRNGYHEQRSEEFVRELVDAFELRAVLHKRTQEVSKGELQRTLLAFCLLYGSRALMMDEPVFALEERQKRSVMGYLYEYAHREGLTWFYSVHELELSAEFSDYVALFRPDAPPLIGPTAEVHTRDLLERAYDVPFDFLKRREALYRQALRGAFPPAAGPRGAGPPVAGPPPAR